jgi:WD40 repeat protein/energy-coupling factor transporter ATP-binding protein EcfA2
MSDFPYPGLRPFQRSETDIFFGREEHTDQLLEKLDDTHFLAVVGPSGCGKSSLVRTGLLAGLETGFLATAGVHWRIADFRPGNRPFFHLAKALLVDKALGPEYSKPFSNVAESLAFLQAELRRGPLSLHEILAETPLPKQTNLLLLVDQFEEIFRYYQYDSADEAVSFIALLLACSQHNAIYIVITMRSDFIGDSALFYDLPEKIGQGLFLTPRLTREQIHDAITEPAKVFGGSVEPTLVNRLLNEIGNDPDQLPLLQHSLMRMWNLASRNDNPIILNLSHYEQIGGLTTALSKHADKAYAEITDKKIARILFCNLTERGEGHLDIRRPVKLQDVANQAQVSWQQVAIVVEAFRKAGRSFLTPMIGEELEANSIIDISHESLIRHWQRLIEWIQEEAESADFYKRLEDSAIRWNKKQADLLSDIELDIALAWRNRTQANQAWAKRYGIQQGKYFDLTIDFLKTSETKRQAQEHRKRLQAARARQHELKEARKQTALIWAISGFIVAVVLAFWGISERHQALLAQQQTAQLEQDRRLSLFNSQLTHAALLARDEDYLTAKQVLNKTYQIDQDIPQQYHHSRNLLAWFNQLMGAEPKQIYQGANTQLLTLAISPDGKTLATAGENGTIVLFDVKTGKLIKRLQKHTKNIQALVFHSNFLISAGDDQQIIFWSLSTAKPKMIWKAPAEVNALAISPNGDILASGGEDNNITLWNINTSQIVTTLKGHEQAISTNGLAFASNGYVLGSTSHDHTARLWNVTPDTYITDQNVSYLGNNHKILKGHTDILQGITFSPNGNKVATSSLDGSVRLWNVKTGKALRVLIGHKNTVFGVRFLANGIDLITASQDRTLRLWDTESGITKRVLQGHTGGVTDVIAKSGQIFSASHDGKVMRWNVTVADQYILNLPSEPASAAISPNGKYIAVGFANGALHWYSLANLTLLWQNNTAHSDDIQRIVFSSDTTMLATASFDKTAKLWQVNNERLYEKQIFTGHKKPINSLTLSSDNSYLATASYDGRIGLFKIGSQKKRFQQIYTKRVYSVKFNNEGKQLLTSGRNANIQGGYTRLWQINDNLSLRLIREFPKISNRILWSSFSPNNQWIASVGRDWIVNIFSNENKEIHKRLIGHENTILRAIFSPDNKQIATVSGDATVRFWDLNNNEELFKLRLPSQIDQGAALWDFDFRCTSNSCRIVVPLTNGKLVLYKLGQIY